MKNKLITLFLALAASVGTLFAQSGTCGDNLKWTLDTESGILTISGTGAMTNYTSSSVTPTTPWKNYLSSIKTVIIEDGVISIGNRAFYYCSSLTSISIPNSVTSIGSDAFYNCTGLTSVTIPNSVTSIGNYAFYECRSLTSITVDSENPNYCVIDGVLFNKNKTTLIQYPVGKSATSYTIPNSVTSIGDGAFNSCSSLTSITIPNSVTSIGWNTFSTCTSLTSITIPNSVTSIGQGAFAGCSSLTSVTIPNSVTSIVSWTFSQCTSLTSVTIPNSVTSIGNSAFSYCSKLTSITMGNNVTSIGDHAFYYCTGLTSITIPNSVTSIGYDVFYNCTGLTSVTIPNSVTSIGSEAFRNCGSLTSVTCEAINPPELENNGVGVFYGVDKSIPLYVPAQSIDLYKATDQWKDFTNILPINSSELPSDITLQENESSDYYTQFAQDYNGHTVTTATLNRQFTQGKWATLCLPFNVNKAMMMALGLYNRVFEFRYVKQDASTINIYFATARSIEAGKGYIVNPNAKLAAKTSFVFPNVTINTDSDNGDITALTGYNDGTGRGNLFLVGTLRTGILQGTTSDNTYLGLKDNQLYYPNTTSGTSIRAYRGFFRSDIPVNASRVRIIADGEPVSELEVVGTAPSDWSDKSDPSYTPARKYLRNGILYIRSNGVTYTAQGQRID